MEKEARIPMVINVTEEERKIIDTVVAGFDKGRRRPRRLISVEYWLNRFANYKMLANSMWDTKLASLLSFMLNAAGMDIVLDPEDNALSLTRLESGTRHQLNNLKTFFNVKGKSYGVQVLNEEKTTMEQEVTQVEGHESTDDVPMPTQSVETVKTGEETEED